MRTEVAGGHFWHDRSVETEITPAMTNDSTKPTVAYKFMDRWNVVQHELMPMMPIGARCACIWQGHL